LIVAVDEGRDFRLFSEPTELLSQLGLLALAPFLVEIFAPEISPGNDLNDSLDAEV
jgi:hypothetical protein